MAFFSLAVVAGLLSAMSWGTGDFIGGIGSRRSNAASVTLMAAATSVLLLALAALIVGEAWPDAISLFWAAGAGVAGAVGLLFLYQGLAGGTMGIVAPVSGIVGAAVPILVAALTQGMPAPVQLAGFLLALAAVWLLASGGTHDIHWRMLVTPVIAGLGFGFFYVLMARVDAQSFFWPLTAARATSLFVLLPWALLRRQPLAPPRALLPLVALGGVFDTGGNLFYLLAAQSGRLDTAAVLSSLYPAMTVLLAWLVLNEKLSRPQWVGVAAALVAIPLIVA